MENSFIHQLFKPKLENPIFVEGLLGFGNVGKIVSQLLIRFCEARLFAEYYSPFFPDYVSVNDDGICRPPHYKLYVSSSEKKLSAIILTGDSQAPLDNVEAHYEISEEVLDFVQKLGCRFVVTIGGVPVSTDRNDVYVAATSKSLATDVMEKGAIIYSKGRIMGATGLLLGLAKMRGLSGFCLLGATSGSGTDKDAGSAVFQMLLKALGQEDKQRS
ncbi:MAG: PAC2 family protein [Candidatus Bathyarchaeota archaeon]|nr:MAG: PAC2 family protein [Candidatus Bathyarchaeota archaeon]